jgi:hypothetical protein
MTDLLVLEDWAGSGREEEARHQLDLWDTSAIRDAFLHVRIADLCEELGMSTRLISELNFALRDDPQEPSVLRRLAQAHLDAGRSDRAWKCYQQLIERAPEEEQTWLEAVELLVQMERHEEARALAEKGVKQGQHRELQARLRMLSRRETQESEQALVGTNSPALLARFVSLFAGREGVYARQWAKDRLHTGYTPIHQPFSHRVAQNHLQGNHTVGIYPLRLDGTVVFAAIDLDLQRSMLLRHQPGDVAWEQAMQALHQYAQRLLEVAKERDLHAYLEDSGGKGRHLWCFFAQPLAARSARALCQNWLQWAGPPPLGVGVEVFPKQAQLQRDQLGNLIKLPLGLHRGSGRRGEFLDAQGQPYEDQETFLMGIRRNPKESVLALLSALPWVEEALQEEKGQESAGSVAVAPVIVNYDADADLELQTLLVRCSTLRALYEQAKDERHLTHDQAQVVQHTLGYLRSGVEATNHVLAMCPDVGANYHLKSPLRGNPMSCGRIRARIPETTSRLPCNCEFKAVASYPTPVLHLQGEAPQATQLGVALATDYLHALEHWKAAVQRLTRLQQALLRYAQEQKMEEIQTAQGVLVLKEGTAGLGSLELR